MSGPQCNGWPLGVSCDRPAIGGDEDGNLGCIKHAPRFGNRHEMEMYLDAVPGEGPERWIEDANCTSICLAECDACPCADWGAGAWEATPDPIDEVLWALFGWLWDLDPDGLIYWPDRTALDELAFCVEMDEVLP